MKEEKIYSEFEYYKRKAQKAYDKGNYDDSFEALSLACTLARNYYLCFSDDTIEQLLADLSSAFTPVQTEGKIRKKRIVFYDTFALDNMALSRQYLEAIMQAEAEILYITTENLERENSRVIRKIVDSSDKVHHVLIEKLVSGSEYIERLQNTILDFGPEKAFIQTTAIDIPGIVAWTSLNQIERYLIDCADHVFQAGRKMFDYYFAFRSLGYNIAVNSRKIEEDRILCLPFYPIINNQDEYRGIPEQKPGTIKILSGARIEKIYGQNDLYFELLEKVLNRIENCEIYFIGAGAYGRVPRTSYVIQQSRKRNFGERFHLLDFRSDLVELMQHMDIYIGTYPIGGGLMTQIAASQGLPIVEYVSEGLSSSVGEFIEFNQKKQPFVFEDTEVFVNEVQKLADDSEYRKRSGMELQRKLFTKNDFNSLFMELLETKKNHIIPDRYTFSCDKLRENQMEIENNCSHDFSRILVRNRYVRFKQPIKYFFHLLMFTIQTDKKWLFKKVVNVLNKKIKTNL